MSARLCELRFTPRGPLGWHLPPLEFGEVLTLVMGPNGAGKTPIVRGLTYAFGHPIDLPPDIARHCKSVVLTLEDAEGRTTIERLIEPTFTVSVTDPAGVRQDIADEAQFTQRAIDLLGIPTRQFAGVSGTAVGPYTSVLLPICCVDQDNGWHDLYSPLHNRVFLKDQATEIARWMLGVPSKHRAVDKSAFAKAKAQRDSITELIAMKRNTVAELLRALPIGGSTGAREHLVARREALIADLKARSSVIEVLAQSSTALDERLATAIQQRDAAKFALDAGTRQIDKLKQSSQELQAEVSILETNEVASDAFRVLCGNEACQFFRHPEESYGRKLLYLKDQLKDFGTSASALEAEVAGLRSALDEQESRVARAKSEKESSIASTQAGQIVPLIDAITKELTEVNLLLERLDRLVSEQKQLDALVERDQRAAEVIAELRPTGGGRSDQTRLTQARSALSASFEEWLITLRTQNVEGPVAFDEDLRLILGTTRFNQSSPISGSTRTRIVIAFHAALIEASIKTGGYHPRFLVLDAPKQHELHARDLGAFVTKFREMSLAQQQRIQLVIAATEQEFVQPEAAERIARPQYGTVASPRFFGTPPVAPKSSEPQRGDGTSPEEPPTTSA